MITLTFPAAFMLYLALSVAVVLGAWVYSHYAQKRKPPVVSEELLCICEYCHCAYLAKCTKQINNCPQCGLYNRRTF